MPTSFAAMSTHGTFERFTSVFTTEPGQTNHGNCSLNRKRKRPGASASLTRSFLNLPPRRDKPIFPRLDCPLRRPGSGRIHFPCGHEADRAVGPVTSMIARDYAANGIDVLDAMQQRFLFVALFMVIFIAVVVVSVFVLLVRPWLRAVLHGAPVSPIQIVAMRLRGNPPVLLIDAYIALKRAGLSETIGDVENVYIDARNRVTTSDDLVEAIRRR
jgi:hypothetical protein